MNDFIIAAMSLFSILFLNTALYLDSIRKYL